MIHRRHLPVTAALAALAAISAPAGAAVQFEEAINDSSNGSFTFTTSIQGGASQTYVMLISTRSDAAVTGVTGGGLTWTERVHQCGDGSETSAWVFTARGSPASAFAPTVSVASGWVSAVCLRYSGAGPAEDWAGQNINGESGACTNATDTNQALLTLSSTVDGSVHVAAVAPRKETVNSTNGYTYRQEATGAGGPNTTSIFAYDKTFDPAATEQFQADLSSQIDWATAGVVLPPATQVLAMASAADQSFDIGDPATGISAITITEGDTAVITAANDIRVRIPAGFSMTWDAADVTAAISGTADTKVSSTVTYEDSDATLVIDVTSDFAAGDSITVSGLSFANFTAASSADNLELDVNNDTVADATDTSTIRINGPTGSTYYVRKSGSDSADGLSPATAWLTIGQAAVTMGPGDWVYVGAGVYDEKVDTFANSGTAADPIRFVADSDGTKTGDAGTVEITDSSDSREVVQVDSRDYIEFVGFRISGGLDTIEWNLGSVGGLLEDCEVTGGARAIDASDSNTALTITNCEIHTTADEAITVNTGATLTVTGTSIHGAGLSGIIVAGSGDTVTASECRIYANTDDGVRNDGTFTAVNCLIDNNIQKGVHVTSSGTTTLWHCTIDANGHDGFKQADGAAEIRNCIITSNGQSGIELVGGTIDHTYNLVWNNAADYVGTSAHGTEISADPLFVSAANRHLQSGSPAIDQGTDGSSMTTVDYDGQTRPADAGWDMGYDEYGPSVAVAISSEDDQTFGVGDPTTIVSPVTITDSVSPQIDFTSDIRVMIPAGFNMTWNTSDTQAVISGSAASKVSSTVTYAGGGKTLVIDVTTSFSPSDTIIVSGLSFTGFSAYSARDNLELDVDNDGIADAVDTSTIRVGTTGNIYYVRVTGSDAADGLTPATAWQSISHAAAMMFAGDWVYVGAGTYDDQFSSSNDGTPTDPIRFIADTGGARTGDAGTVEITDSSGTVNVLLVSGNDYYEFIGFRLSGGFDTVSWSGSVGGRLENCEITGAGDQGIYVTGASELTIVGCNIHGQTMDGIWLQDNGTVTIVDTIFRNNGRDGVYLNNGTLGDNATMRVERCIIDSNLDDGVDVRENFDVEVVNCLIRGHVGLQDNVTTHSEATDSTLVLWHCTIVEGYTGIDVNAGTVTVRNCIVVGNEDVGINLGAGTIDHDYNLVWNNTVADYSGTTAGANDVSSDPLFVGATDYHLQSSSPAMNVGTDASAQVTTDIDGDFRPDAGGWDMGYDEQGIAGGAQGPRIVSWREIEP